MYYAGVFVRASCYELHDVVQTRGETRIGDGPRGIMFFSGTAMVPLTVQMIACIHKVFTVSSRVQTYTCINSYLKCLQKNKSNHSIKAPQVFYKDEQWQFVEKQHQNTTCCTTCSCPTNTHTRTLPCRLCDHQGRDKPYLRVKQRAGGLVF